MFTSKKLAGFVVAVSLLGFAIAPAVQASSLTSTQISAILSLLQSFGADQGTINSVSATLGGSSSASLSCSSFSTISYGQFDNSPGGPVSQLQTWLGIPSTTFGFGTYGKKTQAAYDTKCEGSFVTDKQSSPSTTTTVVSSQTPGTPSATIDQSSLTTSVGNPTITGTARNISILHIYITAPSASYTGWQNVYGSNVSVVAGSWSFTIPPTYLTAGNYHVSVQNGSTVLTTGTLTVTGVSIGTLGFVASPQSGAAPLQVQFKMNNGVVTNPTIDFGDGIHGAVSSLASISGNQSIFSHTYSTAGTYVANVVDPATGENDASLTIAVGGSTSGTSQNETATIDQNPLTTPSLTPTISGTASGMSQVIIAIVQGTINGVWGAGVFNSGLIPVTNGRWSTTVSSQLPPGNYTIHVDDPEGEPALVLGALTIQ